MQFQPNYSLWLKLTVISELAFSSYAIVIWIVSTQVESAVISAAIIFA